MKLKLELALFRLAFEGAFCRRHLHRHAIAFAQIRQLGRGIRSREIALRLPIILVEHQMDLVMDLVDRLLVLAFGKVVATGTPDEIRSDERVVEAFVGVGP